MVVELQDLSDVRLLVLDDEAAIGETISLMAKRLKVDCRFTTAADEFFELLRQWQPTHITLDLAMPDFDGIEAMRRLAELDCKATIILVSGMDSRVLEAARRAAENHVLNVAGTIAKPFSIAVLRDFLAVRHDRTVQVSVVPETVAAEPKLTKAMLVKAMDAGQIDVVFQPKVRCADSALTGFEALARWTHPMHGPIPPDRFVALAERTGLCGPLTEIIYDKAMSWFSRLGRSDLTLALNLSARSLDDIELADHLAAMCEKHGIEARHIVLEVTESSSIYDQTAALDLLVRLRLKGFHLSIDDFGVGYSSLSQLARIPFSELKIDRSFVMSSAQSSESRSIIKAIVGLAHSLGLSTVAEGVEDLSAFGFLRGIGCDQVQGYLIGRPMNREAISAWMGPVAPAVVDHRVAGGTKDDRQLSAVAG